MILAKVTGPLMSIGASGKYGDVLTFFNRNGEQFVRMPAGDRAVNSMAQLECQSIFEKSALLYQKLSDYDRKAWKLLADNEKHNAFNHFTGLAYRAIDAIENFIVIYNLSIDEIYANTAIINFSVSDSCQLKLYLKEGSSSFKEYAVINAAKEENNLFELTNLKEDTDYNLFLKAEIENDDFEVDFKPINNIKGDYYIDYGLSQLINNKESRAIIIRVNLTEGYLDKENPVKFKEINPEENIEYCLYRLDNNLELNQGLIQKGQYPKISFNDIGQNSRQKMPVAISDFKLITAQSGIYSFKSF